MFGFPRQSRDSCTTRLYLPAHAQTKVPSVLRSAKFINDCGRVPMVRRSRSMGGHLTDLINMADCQEWKGQRFKKIYVRKTTQHEEKFFKLSFKGMIRFDLNMEHDEVYGKFVLTVCICSILYFCKKFADCKKTDSASLSQEV